MIHRHAARFIRHLLQQFRAGAISAAAAAAELEISLRRFYGLWHSYLQAVARRRAHRWQPGVSGGNRRRCWPEPVTALMRKLLGSRPPCPYSFIASEVHRRCDLKLHRASVRRWALAQGLAPAGPTAKPARPVRRWQVQHVGQLWQYDASPHRWFVGQDWQPPLLEILDDHSRVITGARLYPRETLLAHLDFLSDVFRAVGLPLCLYVDYHSFFFTHTPDALTQLGAALRFYGVSLRYAPTPQAKGKVERVHLFWQNRLPPLFVAEGVTNIPSANPWIEQLRQHHNPGRAPSGTGHDPAAGLAAGQTGRTVRAAAQAGLPVVAVCVQSTHGCAGGSRGSGQRGQPAATDRTAAGVPGDPLPPLQRGHQHPARPARSGAQARTVAALSRPPVPMKV